MSVTTYAVLFLGGLVFVGVASFHHWGWEGLAVPAGLWLLSPPLKVS